MTGTEWINLWALKSLSLQDLKDRLADSIAETQRQHQEDLWGSGGVLGSAPSFTYSSSELTLAADRGAWTGTGHRLVLDASDPSWQDVPFADSGATTYYIGARRNDVPVTTEVGANGLPGYSYYVEAIGEQGAPDNVVDNGDGTLTLNVTTLVEPIWAGAATRPVTVWLVSPEANSAEAIYEGVAEVSGAAVVVEVPHVLGQDPDSPSTLEASYLVHVHGPTVSLSDLSADTDYAFLGTVASGTYDSSAVPVLQPIGDWIAAFDVEHDHTTGKHTAVDAASIKIRSAGDLSLQGGRARFFNGATEQVRIDEATGSEVAFLTTDLGAAVIDVSRSGSGEPVLQIRNKGTSGGTDEAVLELERLRRYGTGGYLEIDVPATGDSELELINDGGGSGRVDWIVGRDMYAGGDGDSVNPGRYRYTWPIAVQPWVDALGGVAVVGAATRDYTATPPHVRSASATDPVVLWAPLDDTWLDGESRTLQIVSIRMYYSRVSGATVETRLMRALRDGTGAPAAVATCTGGDITGAWVTAVEVQSHTVDRDYRYWIEIELDPVSADTDAAITGVTVAALVGSAL